MAFIFITEYRDLARVDGAFVAAGREPGIAEQRVAVGGASAQSSTFNAKTNFVMIETDAVCHLKFGDDPTAVTTAHRMAANEVRFYGVAAGQKVAVIAGV